MARGRTGSILKLNGKYYARVTFKNETGKRREVKRAANNKTEAREKIKQLLRILDDGQQKVLESYQMTFADLAEYYLRNHVQPPVHARRTDEDIGDEISRFYETFSPRLC